MTTHKKPDADDRTAKRIPYTICPHQEALKASMKRRYFPQSCAECRIKAIARALRRARKQGYLAGWSERGWNGIAALVERQKRRKP